MNKDRMRAFSKKVISDVAGGMSGGLAYLGVKTGLFMSMANRGALTEEEVVQSSGLQERYVVEWLHGMVAAGYIDYDPDAQTYTLPAEHAHFVASEGTDHFLGGLFHTLPTFLRMAPDVANAFHNGGGVPYAEFGQAGIETNCMISSGLYDHRLASEWLGELPDVVAKLESGGRVLDFGCGAGQAGLALARAYPNSGVVGVDVDEASITSAQVNAVSQGLSSRVEFRCQRIEDLDAAESFDLVLALDCIHDLDDPVGILRTLRRFLTPTGVLFVMELRAGDRLEENIHPRGAMFYGFSMFHCLTQSLATGGAALGNSIGPARIQALLKEAGYSDVRLLEIRNAANQFFASRP